MDLLEADQGPVLADFGEDVPPPDESEMEGWSCPVNLSPPPDDDDLASTLARELASLLPWYDLSRKRRGRTTVGASGLPPETAIAFVAAFLDGQPHSPRDDLPIDEALKQCLEDLKALYAEAATAQPGTASPDAVQDWFWHETVLGAVLVAVRGRLLEGTHDGLKTLAEHSLVPRTVLEGQGGDRPPRPKWHTPQ